MMWAYVLMDWQNVSAPPDARGVELATMAGKGASARIAGAAAFVSMAE
jgi:hypothetical protein